MKLKIFAVGITALLPAAALTFTSCSSTPPPGQATSSVAYEHGVPGGVVVQTFVATATVTDIDQKTRHVTLLASDGRKTTFKAGPEIINLDQIHVGDQVKATLTEQLVVYLADAASPGGNAAASVVALAPKGGQPGGMVADTVQVTARVTDIDVKNHKATLQFPDGSTKTVAVRPDVDLTKRRVGEEVVMRITEMVAVKVEKP